MFTLEGAQFINGRFAGWQELGEYPSKKAAQKAAADRGIEPGDFIISASESDPDFPEDEPMDALDNTMCLNDHPFSGAISAGEY